MSSQKIASIALDLFQANAIKEKADIDLVEVVLKTIDARLDEKLMVIKELSYPLPVFARIEHCDEIELHPLLQRLAIAGLSGVTFQIHSESFAKRLKAQVLSINSNERLGLTFKFIFPS